MRVSRKEREGVKNHIIKLLGNGKMQSTEDIRKDIGRSWAMTLFSLKELYEESRIEQYKIGRMRFWQVVE